MIDVLRQQLLAMVAEDRRVRAELAATGELYQGYAPRMEDVHRRNAEDLLAILEMSQGLLASIRATALAVAGAVFRDMQFDYARARR